MQVGVGKNCISRLVVKSLAQALYRRKLVSINHGELRPRNHDGALAEEYAVSSTTLVVVEV